MSELVMPLDMASEIVREVRSFGTMRKETGGFLLAPDTNSAELEVLALAGTAGIRRKIDLFVVSGTAIERLFTWASHERLAIRAQVHSHGRRAFLSRSDIRHGFTVEGFVTSVVPYFLDPPATPDAWGWWQCRAGRWREHEAPDLGSGTVRVVRFDEDGVHAA